MTDLGKVGWQGAEVYNVVAAGDGRLYLGTCEPIATRKRSLVDLVSLMKSERLECCTA